MAFKIDGLKVNTKYTLCRVNDDGYNILPTKYAGFNAGKNNTNRFIDYAVQSSNLKSVTATTNVDGTLYIVFYMSNATQLAQYIELINNCWVIEGESFVEREQQTFTFPLGNEKLMLGDYLADDGIHHVRKQIVLNGSENWTVHGSIASWFHWDGLTDGFVDNTISGYALSNYFTQKPYSTVTSLNNGEFAYGQVAGATRKRLVLKDTDYTTAADFKTWLSTHNVTVEYELEEEVIVPYTSAQQEVYNQIKQALSYEEQTNISSNQNALFSVEAYQSTKLVLKEMATAIVALGGV